MNDKLMKSEEEELELIAGRVGCHAILKWVVEQVAARKKLTDPDIPDARWAENRAANYQVMLELALVKTYLAPVTP